MLGWIAASSTSGVGLAEAQGVRPWVPPSADSLVHWAAEAKARFQTNTGDSIGGSNLLAYELVGQMGRRLMRSLGRGNASQAHAMEPVLDSLGLDTDVEVDTRTPGFALLMVRNPYHLTADAVGYLFWWRGDDLRVQGVLFSGGQEPEMRVWWTGHEQAPYEWAVVERERGRPARVRFSLFRLTPTGSHWILSQFGANGPDFGDDARIAWADLDGDFVPELVAFAPAGDDSLFESCQDCPKLLIENIFVERAEGFRLFDSRLVPTPYSTLAAFVRNLSDGNRTAASRLLKQPSRVEEAIRDGWGLKRGPHGWKIEGAEPDTPWPRWLQVSGGTGTSRKRWTVRFEHDRGRWVISDWKSRTASGGTAPGAAPGRP